MCGIEDKKKEKTEWLDAIKFFKDNCFSVLKSAEGKLGAEADEAAIKADPLLNLKKKEIDEEMAEKKQDATENSQD